METILAELPNLSIEELKTLNEKVQSMANIRTYFEFEAKDQDFLPSNATALVTDGTIKLLEVLNTPEPTCKDCSEIYIKMKIKGIEEMVYLNYCRHNTKYATTESKSIEIGNQKYVYAHGIYADLYCDAKEGDKVLQRLHEVLEIPKHQTAKMIFLLFYPYCDFCHIKDKIKPLECKDEN